MMMTRMKMMKTRDPKVSDRQNRLSLSSKTKTFGVAETFSWICFIVEHACANLLVLLAFAEVQLEQKSVPTAVFGGLKDDWKRDPRILRKFFWFLLLLNRLCFEILCKCIVISIFFYIAYYANEIRMASFVPSVFFLENFCGILYKDMSPYQFWPKGVILSQVWSSR